MEPIRPIPLDEIRAAQSRISSLVFRTPLIALSLEGAPAEIYLKLENLQPIGSFKIRGAANAIEMASEEELAHGVITASAGNMAQGVAWNAQRRGLPCTVVIPEHAPQIKLEAVRRMGGKIIKLPFSDWWQVLLTRGYEGSGAGMFIHPVSDPAVIAGNGTIGLEILEDLPDVDAVLVPYGGGGLSCGIGSAIRALKPNTAIFGCEVETAAPLAASLAADEPRSVDYTPSFVDGIGGKSVLPEMWSVVRDLLDGSLVSTLHDIASAIRLLAERCHVIAEGAGAASVAAALSGKAGSGKIVCIISGGNIDAAVLAKILTGEM
jgi:threonine dehydratase